MMNVQINQLVKSLLQKDSLEQCSLHELEQFAERHPHFGAAQLLLTKKMQTEQSAGYDAQLQKTYLFFHNPLWVEQILNDTGNATVSVPENKYIPVIASPITETEPITPVSVEESTAMSDPINEVVVEELQITVAVAPVNTVEENEQPHLQEAVALMNEEDADTEEITTPGPDEPAIKIPGLKIEAIDPAKAELVFEPYHTVDYFASQGINIKEDDKPKTKFDLQLRSFTDWIKAMKKLPATEISKSVEAGAEKKVEQLAQHSLAEREVVTEAMAEVWEKQGNTAKAVDIYRKLSLLDPSKSTYFAAKIEDLNKLT